MTRFGRGRRAASVLILGLTLACVAPPLSAQTGSARTGSRGDSTYEAATARRIGELQTRYAEERRQRMVARLEQSEAESELRAERRASQRNDAIAFAVLLALVTALFYRRRVEHARLVEEWSITDPLTQAKNRRYMEQTIAADLAVSARRHLRAAGRGVPTEDGDIVFLLLDIDRFKDVNDRYGHATGDQVLRDVVAALGEICRQSDVIVRWGGDEFLIIGRFTDRALAGVHAQRLREVVEACQIRIDGRTTIQVTCSVGYSAYPLLSHNPEANTWTQLVALADHASYIAKGNGRNRCAGVFAAPGLQALDTELVTRDFVTRALAAGRLVLEDDAARTTNRASATAPPSFSPPPGNGSTPRPLPGTLPALAPALPVPDSVRSRR